HDRVRCLRTRSAVPQAPGAAADVLRQGELQRPGHGREQVPRRPDPGVAWVGRTVRRPAVPAEDVPQRRAAGRVARLPGARSCRPRRGRSGAPRRVALGPAEAGGGIVSEEAEPRAAPVTENELWLLSYYRSSEINGALFFGRVARTIRGPLQVDVTHHFADEA